MEGVRVLDGYRPPTLLTLQLGTGILLVWFPLTRILKVAREGGGVLTVLMSILSGAVLETLHG